MNCQNRLIEIFIEEISRIPKYRYNVLDDSKASLILGLQGGKELSIVQIQNTLEGKICEISTKSILENFKSVFQGVGKIGREYKIKASVRRYLRGAGIFLQSNVGNTEYIGILGVIVYSDDVLILASTVEQHNEFLSTVLRKFKKAGLIINQEQSAFCAAETKFFGHTLSPYGISVDPEKTEAIQIICFKYELDS